MLDEIQTLGEVSNGDAIISTLRAVLHKRKDRVAAVFTGSSQSGLARIMSTAGTPMYQFAQLFMADDRQVIGWKALLDSLDVFDRSVLRIIAQQLPPMGQTTLKLLAQHKQVPTVAKVRSAIERLRKTGVLTKDGSGTLQIEDKLLSEYLVTRIPP
jgi:hypothetical protein